MTFKLYCSGFKIVTVCESVNPSGLGKLLAGSFNSAQMVVFQNIITTFAVDWPEEAR